ncbi:PKD domain-containing protein [Haladaptatus caseinilyticus]|uniref:PKD domain-containing protein n=1 Tax=Haladaptatus caseinilyticus TaxID=2993314 RepID=UPI00224AC96A|nr:PKD domain-containing protein [Haladaptatus caseinilyticus]
MTRAATGILILLLLTPSFVPSLTAANEPPLVDAGLDQEVARGATVLLNANESYDPNGEIEHFEWSITTPDGQTIAPDCPTCPRTQFRPTSVGTYTVSVTVTDEDGASSHDSLFVSVSPGVEPSVSVSGSKQPRVSEQRVYSATIEAGAAPLDRIVWNIDGSRIATHPVSGGHASDTITRTFANAGSRTISATVYDSDGQSETDTFDISVQPLQNIPPRNMLADQYAPNIVGDELITGSTPLRGTYNLQSAASSGQLRSISWFGDAKQLGNGRELSMNWQPGDHSLYAVVTYSDNSRDIARFSGGSTTVTADPKPSVELSSLDNYGSVSGRATATDGYENLQSITVRLGGSVIGRTRMDGVPGEMQRRQVSTFDYSDFESGKSYTISVIGVDARGQKTVFERNITPAKEPEIIESGFVNGPVDSYHERIDPERYTAHHVLKIDLNGVDAENIDIISRNINKEHDVHMIGSYDRSIQNDTLVLDSYWTAKKPKEYSISHQIMISKFAKNIQETRKSILRVKPSPPELRVDVTNDGTGYHSPRNWGIVVDASDSFDPDGTKLKYYWELGAEPITPDNKTGKFSSVHFARLRLEDGHDLTTSKQFNYLEKYSPPIRDIKELSSGPYKPNDTVRLRVTTEWYEFTKNSYHNQFGLGITTSGVSSDVVKWKKQVSKENDDKSQPGSPRRYSGIIEIRASELAKATENSRIRVFNEQDPTTWKEAAIPNLEVYRRYGTIWTNISIENTEYLIRRPTYGWKLATSSKKRDRFLRNGYSIADKTRDGFEYTLEERIKVRDAEYETRSKTFATKLEHSAFLQTHPDWWSAGHESKKRTWTTIEKEWRDSKRGSGTFTGQTRRVQTEPPLYRTEKQYAYEYDVQKTGTRSVTKSRDVEVTKTDTMYVTKCGLYGICWEVPKTYTYTTTVTKTYTTTETYTYTVTRTETYWAYQKLGWDHRFTGNRRKVKVRGAKYQTQYLYKYQQEHTAIVREYEVKTREKVRDAEYEWQKQMTTTDRQVVESLTAADDWRIGRYGANIKWSMRKSTGTETTTVDTYLEGDTVVTTYATAGIDITKQYVSDDTIKNETIGSKTVDVSYQNLLSESEIKNRLRDRNNGTENNCTGKLHCYN